jgi:DNA-binding IclR family transcriptional regulator
MGLSHREQSMKAKTKTQSLKGLTKGLHILRKFAYEKESWGPREVAKSLGISKSSTLRVLQTLLDENFLSTDRKGKYCIGPELWRLSTVLNNKVNLITISEPILRKYVNEINETMYLFTYSKDRLTFDVVIECSHNLRYHLEIGVPYDVQKGAAGKVILANLPREEVDRIFARFEKDHKINLDELKQKVQTTRATGYSFTVGERVDGIVGFAAPIYDAHNVFWGGVLLTIPEVRYDPKDHKTYVDLVKRCAGEISFVMGSKLPDPGGLKN